MKNKVDAFMEQLRDSPRRRGEKKTRRELWMQPEGARKAPPIRRLMALVSEKKSDDRAISYLKFQFDDQEYEPRLKNEEDLYRWMVAAARKELVPLRAAMLDNGWEIDICLDREDGYWCEGVLRTELYLSKEQYPEFVGRVLARAVKEHADKLDELREGMRVMGVDKAYKHDITKQPVVLSEQNDSGADTTGDNRSEVPGSSSAVATNQATADSSQAGRRSSVSVRSSPPRKQEEQVGRKIDWSKAPKIKDALAQIELEMQQREDST